jgi:hypothetical protein
MTNWRWLRRRIYGATDCCTNICDAPTGSEKDRPGLACVAPIAKFANVRSNAALSENPILSEKAAYPSFAHTEGAVGKESKMHRKVPRRLLWHLASKAALITLLGTHVASHVTGQEANVGREANDPEAAAPARPNDARSNSFATFRSFEKSDDTASFLIAEGPSGALQLPAQQQEPSQPIENPADSEPGAVSANLADSKEVHVAPSDRYFLMERLQGSSLGDWFESNKIQVFGWTDMSFTASTAHDSNQPMGFNYLANEFMLQQNWLRIERPVDTTSNEATVGFCSCTNLPGTDYVYTLPPGLFDSQLTANNGHPNRYGIDPVYFYLEAYFPNVAKGMDVKVGRFAAPYGVEAVDAALNQLASHVYTFIYDPFTQTGILTTTKIADEWTLGAGAVLGEDIFIAPADNLTWDMNLKWAPTDQSQNESLTLYMLVGSGRFNQQYNFHNPEVFDLVYTRKVAPKLTWTLESLYGFTTNVPNTGFANWFSLVNYLTYELTPRLNSTARLEFFDDAQGQRTGSPGLYVAPTLGLNFRPCQALMFRPELRYDNNLETAAFEGRHGLFTANFDVIFRW